jgi:hypothetical protein
LGVDRVVEHPDARGHLSAACPPTDAHEVATLESDVITRGIREYVGRDWAAARDAKDRYWRDRIAQLGVVEGLRAADELRRLAQRLRPGWPGPEDRRRDFEHHVRLAALLRRADSARRA